MLLETASTFVMVNYVNTDKNGWTINSITFPVIPMKKITVWEDLASGKS
jgi:hypothetical protein